MEEKNNKHNEAQKKYLSTEKGRQKQKEYAKKHYLQTKEIRKNYSKEYYEKNKDTIKLKNKTKYQRRKEAEILLTKMGITF